MDRCMLEFVENLTLQKTTFLILNEKDLTFIREFWVNQRARFLEKNPKSSLVTVQLRLGK